jgi:hypothetical protein
MLFLLKIVITPVLVALVSIAARRWGPTFAALIIGIPWMTGPILFFLGLEYGDTFVARTATGTLVGAIAIAFSLLAFTHAARRVSWPWALLAVFVAYGIAGYLLDGLRMSASMAAIIAVASLIGANLLMPRPDVLSAPPSLPWWDIPMRMIATAVLVAIITVSAEILPPELVGVVSSFPVIVTVVGMFTLARWGWQPAVQLVRGVALSLLSFVAFFLVLGATIEDVGLVRSFTVAALSALAVSAGLLMFNRARAKSQIHKTGDGAP